jgi:hypothetical protein
MLYLFYLWNIMNRRIKHNTVIVHLLNEDKTSYRIILISVNGPYVEYSPRISSATRAVSSLIVHHPEFLDRRNMPLWCSHDGKYIKTKDVSLFWESLPTVKENGLIRRE